MSICLGVLKNSFQNIFPVLAQARFHSQPCLLGVFFSWLDVGWWFVNSDQCRLHTLATVTQQRTIWRYASRFQMDVSSYHRQKVLTNNWINKSHSKDVSQQVTGTQTGNISINIHQFTSPFESSHLNVFTVWIAIVDSRQRSQTRKVKWIFQLDFFSNVL